MTVRLIRQTAKEMAGAFYEQAQRSTMFRQFYPNAHDYIHGIAHLPSGKIIKQETAGWERFVDHAKSSLVDMLTSNNVSQHMKDEIEEALKENYRRAQKPSAKRVMQIDLGPREDQKQAYSEAVLG